MGALLKRKATQYLDPIIPLVLKGAHFMYSHFIEPRSIDEDLRRREYILNVILLGSIVMVSLLDVFVLIHSLELGSAYIGVPFWGFSLIPLFFIFLYVLSRRGYFISASYLLVTAYFLSDSYAAYKWSITLTPVMLGYALIIVMASILLGTTFGFIAAGTTALFIVPLWYLHFHHLLPFQTTIASDTDAFVLSALYFVIMIVAWLSNREIERSLKRARKSEKELKEERDLLEVKVEERTHELREAQFEKVEQLSRFAELGRLSSGLFHDMLNILNALSLQIEHTANSNSSKKAQAETSINNAFDATRQIEMFMQAIHKQVNQQESQEIFSLTQSIDQVVQLISHKAIKEKVRIIFENPERSILGHFGNPFKFQQVLLNLLMNGIESYQNVSDKQTLARTVVVNITEHEHVIAIIVKDNGVGMNPEMQGKIFEPFFTTKTGAKGMGVGLATVKKIIEEDFEGTIGITSEEGKGSVFAITFPLKTIGPQFKAPSPQNNQQRH